MLIRILEAVDVLRKSKVKTWDDRQCEADVRHRIDNIEIIWKEPPSDPELRDKLKVARHALQKAAKKVPRASKTFTITSTMHCFTSRFMSTGWKHLKTAAPRR